MIFPANHQLLLNGSRDIVKRFIGIVIAILLLKQYVKVDK